MTIGHIATPNDAVDRESDRWTVADLIDLEFYLSADEAALHADSGAGQALSERDRSLYLENIAPALAAVAPHTREHRRLSLRRWLSVRRAAESPDRVVLLPGHAFAQALRLTGLGLGLLGFILGVGAASALLSYDGHRPINIAWYLFLLVFVQFLVIGGTTAVWLVRRMKPVERTVQDLSLLGRLIRPLVTRVSDWLLRHRAGTARQEARDLAATQVGRLRAQHALYGPVSFLPMLVPAQVFGVAFNIGVILTTIALEWFTDLAFGWGTALDLNPSFIYDLARMLAWPWGWLFGEGIGYPTLDQVAGSRILLKDPLFLLDAGHLRSWRWFLVLAVLTYALLPRLLLLAASLVTQRHLLQRLPLTQARTQALYARLLTPKVETAMHGSGHGPAMPIPAPVVHRGPVARPIGGDPAAMALSTIGAGTPPPPRAGTAPAPSARPAQRPPARVATPQVTTLPAPALRQANGDSQAFDKVHPGVLSRHPMAPEPPPVVAPEPPVAPELPVAPEPLVEAEPLVETEPQAQAEPLAEIALHLQPEPSTEPEHAKPWATPPADARRGDPVPSSVAGGSCLALIHLDVDDLIDDSGRSRAATLIEALTGWRVAASASFGSGTAMTAGVVTWVSDQRWEDPPARVAVIMDGSQPPITETLRFLRELRAAAGAQAAVTLALVGDPQEDDPLPPVRAFDFFDWQRKIAQLGDPYLRLTTLAGGQPDGEA